MFESIVGTNVLGRACLSHSLGPLQNEILGATLELLIKWDVAVKVLSFVSLQVVDGGILIHGWLVFLTASAISEQREGTCLFLEKCKFVRPGGVAGEKDDVLISIFPDNVDQQTDQLNATQRGNTFPLQNLQQLWSIQQNCIIFFNILHGSSTFLLVG